MARPVEAFAAIALEAREFEDLGALAAMPLETRHFEDLGGYLFEPMIERVRVAQQHAGELRSCGTRRWPRLGQTARERARALFLNDRHFLRWVEVLGSALEPRAGSPRSQAPAAPMPEQASRGAGALDLADRDHLTGLWNRRRFEEQLDRSRQQGERLALLSIDVDAYNDVIDRHGAGGAEEVIRSISHVLAKRLRPNATLARMGGDEFAAVLRGATPQDVQSLADGLCAAVREQSHTTGSSRVHATISIGGAFLDAGTQTHHEALLAADTALYEAKVAGGDRAVLHDSSPARNVGQE